MEKLTILEAADGYDRFRAGLGIMMIPPSVYYRAQRRELHYRLVKRTNGVNGVVYLCGRRI